MSDVCLILEGTYPYVAGGVSSWVYSLIKALHDIDFSIVYLGAHREASKKLHYEIPSNVVEFREYYLFDYRIQAEKNRAKKPDDFKLIDEFLRGIREGDTRRFEKLYQVMGDARTRSVSLHDMLHERKGWEIIENLYASEQEEWPFVDYFWTWRFLYTPFFSLLRTPLPEARVYHSVSTGYAGVIGAMAKIRYGRPFLLTEHGIYTRERKIEIAKADWIYSPDAQQLVVLEGQDFFRDWWIQLFTYFSRLSYDYADEIITLYGKNREVQIEEGADPNKISVIPNGVVIGEEQVPTPREASAPYRIGFVGRVVPIKDVKTFIMACRKIVDQLKDVQIDILGPTDEDPEYFKECMLLAEMQDLNQALHFRGKVNVKDYYPKLDLIVLTSISEAQPLVILEAHAFGLPVVATDVGACAEMLNGGIPDDRLLGASGLITPICDAEATAKAIIRVLTEPGLKTKMGEAGFRRAKTYYEMDDLLAAYQDLYTQYAEEIRWPG